MKKYGCALKAVLMGLLTAQMLSTFHIYRSNLALHQSLSAIQDAGYLAVPNLNILNRLTTFEPAFWGGLFFTFTTGATLTLVTIAAAWSWHHLFLRNKMFFIPAGMIWAGGVVIMNLRGFCPAATSQLLFIPPIVFIIYSRCIPRTKKLRSALYAMVAPFLLMISAILLFVQMDLDLFIGIRDKLLLSNPVGKKLNGFYYRYTMYPAELFKSLDQKLLRTYHVRSFDDPVLARRVAVSLIAHDYLPVSHTVPVDVIIEKTEQYLTLSARGKAFMRTTPEELLQNTQKVLHSFSTETDQHFFFRRFTMFSFFLLIPVVGYGIFFLPLRVLTGTFMAPMPSSAISSALGVILLAALLFFVHPEKEIFSEDHDPAAALNSADLAERVSALRYIYENRLDISRFPSYQHMTDSPHVVERYWLARTLGVNGNSETLKILLMFLDDGHPNVVCMALYALGTKKNSKMIPEVLNILKTSDHWYVQQYAYSALRKMGWKQTKSN